MSSGSHCPWPNVPAARSAAAPTTTACCSTRCAVPRLRPRHRSASTCRPGPRSCCGSGTCLPSENGDKPMTDNSKKTWELIVAPWHLDEHLQDFPVPAGAAAAIEPPLPDGDVPGRVTVLHRAVADTVAGAPRPLLLSGDCLASLAVAAGLQRRY